MYVVLHLVFLYNILHNIIQTCIRFLYSQFSWIMKSLQRKSTFSRPFPEQLIQSSFYTYTYMRQDLFTEPNLVSSQTFFSILSPCPSPPPPNRPLLPSFFLLYLTLQYPPWQVPLFIPPSLGETVSLFPGVVVRFLSQLLFFITYTRFYPHHTPLISSLVYCPLSR